MEDIGTQLIKLAKSFITKKFGCGDEILKRIFFDSLMSYEDLISELTCYAYSKLHNYNSEKSKFSTYIFMLFETCANYLIRNNKKKYLTTTSLDEKVYRDNTLDDFVGVNDEIDLIEKSDILTLWLEGKTQEEIGKLYNLSQSYISRLIKNELNYIREMYTLDDST